VSGLVRMRLQPAEPREWLVHGATIGVQVPLARTTNGVVVPRDALVRSELGLEVIRVSGNRAIRVPVVQLATGEDDVLVRGKDLKVGDRVVTRGGDRLYTGQLLAISEPTP
jgi:multidrug efflux pump subunit AcrA (membrane-fusion protein)